MFSEKLFTFFQNAEKTFFSILKILLSSGFKSFTLRNNNNDCVILGNGPSLTHLVKNNTEFLESKSLICVNHFAESDLYAQLKPEIYVLGAPEMWMDDVEEFHRKKGENLFKSIAENTHWPINLFLHKSASRFNRWQETICKNPLISIHYYNPTPVEGFRWFTDLCFKRQLGMPRPHNVLIPAILLASYIGFKKIFLFGADHSWLANVYVTPQNEVLLTQKHFYDENKAKASPMDKLGKGSRKLHEVIIKWYYAFHGYFIINEFAKKIHIQIINATPDSFIDAFERIELE